MANALRQKATEAYLDDDFVSAIEFFKQASCGNFLQSRTALDPACPMMEILPHDAKSLVISAS